MPYGATRSVPSTLLAPYLAAMVDRLLMAPDADARMAASLHTLNRHLANLQTFLIYTGQIVYVSSAPELHRVHQTDGTQSE
jgi:hypothetical protein